MLRYWLSLSLLAICCVIASAQEKAAKPEITLKVGDPAPKLFVTKWLKGDPVNSFAPGKVYVVEFWATWCGPCIASMPHISEIQAEYRDKGLTITGLTSKDPNNSLQQVEEFVKNRGDIMAYNVAWCEDRATNDAFMKASGQNGIPCSFVVDQKGNIAFIGHPLILDEVIPKVIDGSWKGISDAEATQAKLNDLFSMLQKAGQDPVKGLEQFTTLEKVSPKLLSQFADMKLMLLLRNKKSDEAEQLFETLLTKFAGKKDAMKLTAISRTWSNPQVNTENRKMELAVKAAEEAQKLAGDKDIGSLLAAAQAYDATGNKAKAAEYADKAIEAAPERAKAQIKQMVEKYKK